MVGLAQSWVVPLTIMLAVPLSLVGVLLMGQVPPHPDQLKDETVTRATTSRSVIRWTCSTYTPCSIEHVLPVIPRTFSS
jgi:hypothetical protein